MCIGLMAYIPNQSVSGSLVNIMQGDGQLNHPKIRSNMATRGRGYGNDFFADFLSQGWQLIG